MKKILFFSILAIVVLLAAGLVSCTKNYDLTINVDGQGTTNPAPGSYTHPEGTKVQITASPKTADWKFDYWSGDISGSENPVSVTMGSAKTLTAHFVRFYNLTTSVNGQGIVSHSTGSYKEGKTLTLTATPSSGWQFSNWSGDASGSQSSITISMSSSKTITANFTKVIPLVKSSHLLIIINTSSYGYDPGDRINVWFNEDSSFKLDDCFGHFKGFYSTSGKTLTLDFSGYPAWVITFGDETHFTGLEAGSWRDSGTYQWLNY